MRLLDWWTGLRWGQRWALLMAAALVYCIAGALLIDTVAPVGYILMAVGVACSAAAYGERLTNS